MNHYKNKGCENCAYDNAIHLEAVDCYMPRNENLCKEKKCRHRLILEEIMSHQ